MPDRIPKLVYACEPWEIDLERRELRSGGTPVRLGSRAFEIVEVLVRSASELVTKEDLMQRVWPGVVVGEATLHVHISAVRKALGQDRHLLKTAQGRGYRLLGNWVARAHTFTHMPVTPPQRRTSSVQPPTNFPVIVTRLVGRAEAVQHVRDLISAYRAVTLTGPGGIGKTALAMNAVHGLLTAFEDGAWLVELASISDPDLVPSVVAGVLNLKLSGERITAAALARAIDNRHLLLLLDNCEHLIDTVATVVETVMHACPRTTILATSREIMRVDGEAVYNVPALDVPALGRVEPDHVLGRSAVQLFVTRAKSLGSNFSLDAGHIPAIADICRRLDGIPLAIELAAARATTLGIRELAVRLDDLLGVMRGGRRSAPPRHQTLRATLDWSYELLPQDEQYLLRYLAVFPAGFTLPAAVAVMSDTGVTESSVVNGISNLVSKSFVALDTATPDGRWRLLETTRAYALEKLAKHDEIENAAGNQAAYFRDLFVSPTWGSDTRLSDDDWTRRVREIDNVRSAIDWSFSSIGRRAVGVDLTAAYAPVWLHLSLMQECRDRCERALQGLDLASASHAGLQMWLQIALAASLFDTMGSASQAADLLNGVIKAAEPLGHLDVQAAALAGLVSNYIFQDEFSKARAAAEQLMRVAALIGNPAIVRIADRQTGTALLMLGRPREAQKLFESFLKAHPSADQERSLWYPANHRATARAFLAQALWLQGFLERAYSEAQASIEELHAADHQLLLCRVLYFGLCRIALSTGDFAAAEQSIERLIEAATRLNGPFWQTAGRLLLGKLRIERGEFARGVEELRQALDICRRSGWRMSHSEFLGTLATGFLGLGQLDAALQAVDEGLTAARQGEDGQDLYVAEVLRIKGEVLLQCEATAVAEECFIEALNSARKQEALVWELRAALSLTRMRLSQGYAERPTQILAAVYGRFTEGLSTPDLLAARALLDTVK